jgi:hypothetical protein
MLASFRRIPFMEPDPVSFEHIRKFSDPRRVYAEYSVSQTRSGAGLGAATNTGKVLER